MRDRRDDDADRAPTARPRLLTLAQAAREFDRSPRTLRRWRRLGLLRTVRIGAGTYVSLDEIERLIALPDELAGEKECQ